MSERSALLEALLTELDSMASEMVERTRAEIPGFNRVPQDEHLRDTRASIELLIRSALGEQPGPAGTAELRELGVRRAAQGVPIEDLLRAWRLSITIGTDRARALAERLELSPQRVIEVFQGALGTADEAMVSLTEGHRVSQSEALSARDEFVLAALDGRLAVDTLRSSLGEYGLDPSRTYRALRAAGDPEELSAVATRLSEVDGEPAGLFATSASGLVGFTSAEPDRVRGARVGFGPAVGVEGLAASDQIAMRVLAAVDRFGLAGVHDLSSAGLYMAVLEGGTVGEALLERFVGPTRESPSGEELLASVRAWLDAGMRVSSAAERLHVHENTLRYRLRRYTELTGADLGVTEDLVGVWWALRYEQVGARDA